MDLVDTHCHIQSIGLKQGERTTRELWAKQLGLTADQVVSSATDSGVNKLIAVGCDLEDSKLAIDFVGDRDNCWASIGLHPHESQHYYGQQALLDEFAELVGKPKVVAIGECGFDYYYNHSPRDAQAEVLKFQIELAIKHDLPLIFHVREAFDDFWPIFDNYSGVRGVLHSFTDDNNNMAKAIQRGLYIGVNGIATFAKNPEQIGVYRDIPLTNLLLETDSPFLTPRFERKALNYLPVDLNAMLYKYEKDFAKAARIFGEEREADRWDNLAQARKDTMDELMWDRVRGLYFDYNYVKNKRGSTSSLAAFFPMWAGMVDEQQAESLVKALRRFEHKGGLATTDALPLGQFVLGSMPTQWAYPNGWAPLHFIVVEALERYGYHIEAKRIAMKWLRTNLNWFNQEHIFLEKYNVVTPEKPPVKGLYPSQTGFGWTNAVFERFCHDYIDKPS